MELILQKNIWEQELKDMLTGNYDLTHFLLCSPHSTDPVLNYGGLLSRKEKKEAFLHHLYVNGNKTNEANIIRDICSGGKSTIKIVGNKGCGKTTLVHNLRNQLSNKKSMRTLMLDFGESRSTLKFEHAKEAVAKKVYKRLKRDCNENNCSCLKWITDLYWEIEDSIDENWDANNEIDNLFTKLNDVLNDPNSDKSRILKQDVRHILYKMELFQIILVFILCDMYENQDNLRTVVFLDNLDNMVDIAEIKRSFTNYNNFLNGIGQLFDRINEAIKKEYSYKYTFVFVLRDSTDTYLSTHELAIKQVAFTEYDVSKHYSKKDIALKRINFYIDFIKDFSDINDSDKESNLRTAKLLSDILSDRYVRDTIFDIFNNDYRICLLTMIKVASSGILTEEEYKEIKYNGSAHGSRGVIYRLLFNNFNKNGYFKRINIIDFKNRGIASSSPSRLILTYIANSTDIHLTHDSRVVSFADLLDDVHDKIPNTEVIRCLWEMYNLVSADDWCNLISFAESEDASEIGLTKELQYYNAIKHNEIPSRKIAYSTFRITTSGLTFLTYACIHFEFFACRLFSDQYPPLFMSNALETDNNNFIYEIIINSVLSEVKTCADKLSKTYEHDDNLCNNDNSKFLFKRPGNTVQYHVERMIFAHVQYLDEFRRFVLKKKATAISHTVSDFILLKISEYFSIFENKNIKCSKYGAEIVLPDLKKLLNEAIKDPYNPDKIIGREKNNDNTDDTIE